jgi:hypothetical protein
LIEAGDRFRQAQSAEQPRNSASAREYLDARREAQVTLVRMATDVLRNGGYSDTRDTMRRVTSTLEALSIYGSLPDAPRAGRLAAEVDPPGFDMFAVLLPLGNKTQERPPQAAGRRGAESEGRPSHRKKDELGAAARRREDERRRLVTAAKAAVRDAERALRAARTQVERTATTRQAAAKQAKDAEHRRAESESKLAKVAALANAASERARDAEAGAQEAAKAAESAERALELASRRLEQLTADND